MGMLNSLHRFFIPALAPAMFNVATIVCALAARAAHAAVRHAADHGDRHRRAARAASRSWRCSGRCCAARDFATRRLSTGSEDGLRRVLLLMGPGTIGLAATQVNVFVNTRARHERGHGRRLVAELRVPADVPADRAFRRLDRDGDDAAPSRGMRRATTRRRSRSTLADGPVADARAERPGDGRPHRPGTSNRQR